MAGRLPKTCSVNCLEYEKGFHFLGVLKIAAYLKKHKVDVLYTHNPASLTWGGLAKQLCPKTKWIHGEHGYPNGVKRLKLIQQKLIHRADCVTAVSKNLIEETRIAYNSPNLPIKVISNGVDTQRFSPATEERKQSAKSKLGYTNRDFIMIIVGRLERRKNQQLALHALHNIKQQTIVPTRLRLMIIGEGGDKAALVSLANQLGIQDSVDFLGFRDDIPELLKIADLLLIPSIHGEGMANVILEANAAGLPVIASSIPGNIDLIENGYNGYLLPVDQANSAQQWSDKISTYLTHVNEQETFRLNARTHVKAHFSMDKMISNYVKLYQQFA